MKKENIPYANWKPIKPYGVGPLTEQIKQDRSNDIFELIHRLNDELTYMKKEIYKLNPGDEVITFDSLIDFLLTPDEIKYIASIYIEAGWSYMKIHQNTGSVAVIDNLNIEFRFGR